MALAGLVRRWLREPLQQFVQAGGLVLGVCNGFQVLVKAGLLPNLAGDWTPAVSLIHNRSGRFEDRWVNLEFPPSASPWTRDMPALEAPVRHGEGNFVCAPAVMRELEARQLVAVSYARRDGGPGPVDYPDNPNGSLQDIAGICDPSGRVLGLMPHPEAFMEPVNHPRWTRQHVPAGAGLELLRNGVVAAAR